MIFLASIAMYAMFGLLVASRRSSVQFLLFYCYITAILVVGGFLSAVVSVPITDDLSIGAGQIAYGALLFTTLLATIVARDLRVLRNVIVLVIGIDVFKLAIFSLTARALSADDAINRFDTDPDVFEQTLESVLIGGILIVIEVAMLFGLLEFLKSRLSSLQMIPVYLSAFTATLALDGVLFPLFLLRRLEGVGPFIRDGVASKTIMAAVFSVFLLAFLLIRRGTLAGFETTPLQLQQFLFLPHDELRLRIDQQHEELELSRLREEVSKARSDRLVDVRVAMADARLDQGMDPMLAELGDALALLPGVRRNGLGLRVRFEGDEAGYFGRVTDSRSPAEILRFPARAATGEPWVERRQLDTVALLPLGPAEESMAVLEVPIETMTADIVTEDLAAVTPQLTTTLRPAIEASQAQWAARASIRNIIDGGSLEVVFQPIVRLRDEHVVGFEGLSRFGPGINPADRFAEAARAGMGPDLELLAVRTLLAEARRLPDDAYVSINVSAATIQDPRLQEVVSRADRLVTLEVTEHEPIADYQQLLARFERMENVRLAVDDAGSGYATLQHVLRLRPHAVKVDRAWVAGLHADRPRQVLISGLISLAKEIDATLVAEGVETPAEAASLTDLGVLYAQGFLFGKPCSIEEIAGPPTS